MQYFNHESYETLQIQIKSAVLGGDPDAGEDLDFLKKAVLSFANYVYKVNEEQIETKFAKGVLKGKEYQDVASYFDQTRHAAHEQAIVNARAINRIAAAYGVGQVFLGDSQNRREVGHFCGEVCNWIFENRYN